MAAEVPEWAVRVIATSDLQVSGVDAFAARELAGLEEDLVADFALLCPNSAVYRKAVVLADVVALVGCSDCRASEL